MDGMAPPGLFSLEPMMEEMSLDGNASARRRGCWASFRILVDYVLVRISSGVLWRTREFLFCKRS